MNIETNNSPHQSIKYRVVAGESQWALIWKRFKKHRLAQISGIVLIFLYTIAAKVNHNGIAGRDLKNTITF